ncbi:histidinol-phosphatase [Ancylomarina longa]|uniref:Histidinol-phosphatase n=1 Tax=Ancylomarina longa TaxID=2487017 RepID=A0A434AZX6_9BACT|nr:histidinol-phosphatase [Ancylomarina longa]RUT80140.1 histidinol-phosphatase HisJ family protein [Ancylomarina longa]
MDYFSYHTHSNYCDGKLAPEDYVLKAISLGMKAIGFSSHAPLNYPVRWSMPDKDINRYNEEIRSLKEKFTGKIDIYRSLEIDYIPGITRSFKDWKKELDLDYTIGSVHLVKGKSEEELWFLDGPDSNYINGLNNLFGGNIQEAVRAYFHQLIEMIETQKPDIIGHIDKVKMNNKSRFFTEEESWYRNLVRECLDVVEKSHTIVELNTRGLYKKKTPDLFPDGFFLKECCKRNIPVTISSDAHHPDELLLGFDYALGRLKQIGFKTIHILKEGNWVDQSI